MPRTAKPNVSEPPHRETLLLCSGYMLGMSMRPELWQDAPFLKMAAEYMRKQLTTEDAKPCPKPPTT